MKKNINKSPTNQKVVMWRLSVANQAFGYASGILIFLVTALFIVGIFLAGEEPAILGLWLISLVYVLPFGAAFTLIWIVLSIVQCFKLEKVGTIGSITPKKASVVLGIFLSIAFLLIAAAAVVLIINEFVPEPQPDPQLINAEEDWYTQLLGFIILALPASCFGQAIFNSVYGSKLKKSL